LAKYDAGTLILTGNNSYTGGTLLDSGTLGFANGSLGTGTGTVQFTGGALRWESGNTQDVSGKFAPIADGAVAQLDTNGNNVTLASAITGTGGIAKLGTGTLTLTTMKRISARQPSTLARWHSESTTPFQAVRISSWAAAAPPVR
jgi:fibronectin-binding autotransporter adhesin